MFCLNHPHCERLNYGNYNLLLVHPFERARVAGVYQNNTLLMAAYQNQSHALKRQRER